jgi:hypothetical protein
MQVTLESRVVPKIYSELMSLFIAIFICLCHRSNDSTLSDKGNSVLHMSLVEERHGIDCASYLDLQPSSTTYFCPE